jgi:hypothetical protein
LKPSGRNADRSTIELAAKAARRRLVAFAVPPLGGLGFASSERVDFHREPRASASAESSTHFSPGSAAIELHYAPIHFSA